MKRRAPPGPQHSCPAELRRAPEHRAAEGGAREHRAAEGGDSDYRVDLVEDLPLLIGHAQGLGCLDGPLHLARPDLQVLDVLITDELSQTPGKLKRIRSKFRPADPRLLSKDHGATGHNGVVPTQPRNTEN